MDGLLLLLSDATTGDGCWTDWTGWFWFRLAERGVPASKTDAEKRSCDRVGREACENSRDENPAKRRRENAIATTMMYVSTYETAKDKKKSGFLLGTRGRKK